MLDIAEGQTCQATNFLRAFRTIREATALGLILSEVGEIAKSQSLAKVIQNWHRFALQHLHQETTEKSDSSANPTEFFDERRSSGEDETSVVRTIFGSQLEITKQCKCGKEDNRNSVVFLFDMHYPEKIDDKEWMFTELLSNSISRSQTVPAWCDDCKKYQSTIQKRCLKSLPDVLSINCRLEQPREFELWRNLLKTHRNGHHGKYHKFSVSPPKACRYGKFCSRPGCRFAHGREDELFPSQAMKDSNGQISSFIPFGLKIQLDSGNDSPTISTFDVKENQPEFAENCACYQLYSVVSHIKDEVDGNTLVAAIHVSESYHERKEGTRKAGWYIFNDFAITPVSEYEVIDFTPEWKIPCCFIYTRCDLIQKHEELMRIEQKIHSQILISEASLAQRQTRFSRQFTPLNSSELPLTEGNFVGIDAEFVTLNQEESEMRSDGTLSTVKPSQLCAARITVVRGWGTLFGVPFIDDYISTSEQVVDYLTKFSGIKPGDLDANMSSKHLTTLKTTYQKLLHLVDSKIVFVGHGLKKDFRVINIVVPRDQIIDTAELFRLPNQRYISLKFLAWHFLNIKIQSDSHDSTEDAHTALKLFLHYQQIVHGSSEEQFEKELGILYDTGRQLNWQVPD